MFVFFGVKKTSLSMLEFLKLKKIKIDLIVSINPSIAKKNKVAGYFNLKSFAKKNKIKIYFLNSYSISKNDIKYFSNNNYSIGLAYGWQRIIKSEILDLFKFGIFGFHGSYMKLPNGSGRSPFNWSIRKNKKFIFQNLFKYTDKFDRGPIFNTVKFPIYESDNINSLQFKGFYFAKNQVINLLKKYKDKNKITIKKQKYLQKIITFPKLSFADSKIRFDKNINYNLNIIRASCFPFSGSHLFMYDKEILIIHEAKLFLKENKNEIKNNNKSYILDIYNDGSFIFPLYDGIINVTNYEFKGNIYKYLNKVIF